MKKKIVISMLFVMFFMLFACKSNFSSALKIEGNTNVELGFEYEYKAYLNGKELSNDEVYWKINNDNVTLVDNVVTPIREGSVKLSAILKEDPTKYCIIELNIIVAVVDSLHIYSSIKEIKIGKQALINYRVVPEDTDEEVYWFSSDTSIATVDSGIITGVGEGTVTITARCGSATSTIIFNVYKEIEDIEMYSDPEIALNCATYLDFNIDDPIITTESDNVILIDRYLFGAQKGSAEINVTSKSIPDLKKTFTVKVGDKVKMEEESEDYVVAANALYDKMSVEQRVGQLFVINLNISNLRIDDDGLFYSARYGGGSIVYISDLFEGRPFGNIYITYYNTSQSSGYGGGNSKESLKNYISGMQNYILEHSGVGGIVMAEKSGRTSYNTFGSYFSKYLRNITLGTINDYSATEKACAILASEVSKLGVNTLVSGAYTQSDHIQDSFSNVIEKQVINSTILQSSLANEGIYLAPIYSYSNSKNGDFENPLMYSNTGIIELQSGIGEYGDKTVEAVKHLREDLKYNGIIAYTEDNIYNYSYYDEELYVNNCIDIFNEGIDLFRIVFEQYSWDRTNEMNLMMYDAFVEGVNNGTVDAKKFEEAVKRILIYKLKTGIIDGTAPQDTFGTTTANQTALNKLKENASTFYIDGEFGGLDLDKKTYAFGTLFTEDDVYRGNGNQYNFSPTMFLKGSNYGFTNVQLANLDSSYKDKIAEITADDQVVVLINDMEILYTIKINDTTSYSQYTSWDVVVQEIAEKTDNIVLVFMKDSDLSGDMFDDKYVKIYANYAYEENFDTVLKILAGAKTGGVSPDEK